MSEKGQKATYEVRHRASALPLKADIRRRFIDVRQGPFDDIGHLPAAMELETAIHTVLRLAISARGLQNLAPATRYRGHYG
jgi:hypothetical protein